MSDTLLRQLLMLGMIPRYPHRITTVKLRDRLEDHDYPVDVRTVQRDFNYLSAIFALLGDGARPQGWSRHRAWPTGYWPVPVGSRWGAGWIKYG